MRITHSKSFVDENVVADIHHVNDVLTIDLYGPDDAGPTSNQGVQDGLEPVIPDTPWGKAPLKLLGTLTISSTNLRSLPTWADHCVLLAGAEERTCINVTQQTHISKERPAQFIFRNGLGSDPAKGRVVLFVPFKSSTFEECAVHILTGHEDFPHQFNGVPVSSERISPMQAQALALPKLVLEAAAQIQVGASTEIGITMVDADQRLIERDCELHLEAIGGLLVCERVHLSGGVGTARVLAIGAQPGDIIRIKAGWRFWTGDAEHILVVTA